MPSSPENPSLKPIFETSDQSALAIAESILRDSGIPSVQQEAGPAVPVWDGVRTYGQEVFQLLVAEEDAADAQTLLAGLTGETPEE